MNKIGNTPVPNVQYEARNLVALLTAISTVSRRMARKLALLEKLRVQRKDNLHGN